MSTKAIHIEPVTDLSTEGFIMFIKRFISTRGDPSQIFSDNATNFFGASNQLILRKFMTFKNKGIQIFLLKYETVLFYCSFWVGIWESSIKSSKCHIKRLFGNSTLTFKNFQSVLTQFEAVLIARHVRYPTTPSTINT